MACIGMCVRVWCVGGRDGIKQRRAPPIWLKYAVLVPLLQLSSLKHRRLFCFFDSRYESMSPCPDSLYLTWTYKPKEQVDLN